MIFHKLYGKHGKQFPLLWRTGFCGQLNSTEIMERKFAVEFGLLNSTEIVESEFTMEIGLPKVEEFNLSRGHHEGRGVVHQEVNFVINGLLVFKFQRDSIHIKSNKFIYLHGLTKFQGFI